MYYIFALLVFTAQVGAKPHLLWKRYDSSTTSKFEKALTRSTKSMLKQSVSTVETSTLTSQSSTSTTTVIPTLGPSPTFSPTSSLPTFFPTTSPPTTFAFTPTAEPTIHIPPHNTANEDHRFHLPIIGGIVAVVLVFMIGITLLIIHSKRNKQRDKKRESLFDITHSIPPSETRQQPSVGIYRVTATYTPTLNDEMVVQMGDEIEVLVEYDDGWCQGINLSRDHIKGVFPQHCLDYSLRK
ncbi:hypothetical protein G6F57_007018 [Rhizopus arrhizus]|nr:hypothetical protein G6F30_007903 [Rhizopus arrhizus]KAG1422811.1 hypothetical protein G6F58_003104 [Rhizopus delemar]KAG0982290.1 hypothetical protein G6F29_006411 [Rhizopus arrhizus]KAG0998476.1 hypothetical protein G6F28_001919 [Rhizopus arrhizus]KAG1009593.1 hypothetical protein G6F27_005438 [Rhizopus arrhizus]